VFRNVAAHRLRPLVDRGVAVALFYAQQIEHLPGWFADGAVRHEIRDVISWLRTEWRHSPIWPSVLAATAALVQRSAERAAVPELLLELAAIARSFDGPEGTEQAARYAREALSWVGSAPSRMRCRALRALAAALMRQGEIEAALSQLAAVITAAAVIQDRSDEATALAEIGFHALRSGRFARAETGFRRALALLTTEDLPYLRATVHHHLALALCEQSKDPEEAAQQAGAALELRWDRSSRLAGDDRALLQRIRAAQHRAACSAGARDDSNQTTEDT
jgi:tetratricopeptide (TPR) repeat protein